MISNLLSQFRHKQNVFVPAALSFIVAVGAGLRFTGLAKQPLWMDEAFSVWMSQHSLSEIIRLTIQIDQHPPLYHALLHLWSLIGGSSEFGVRSFSAFLGALTIIAIYYLGKTLSGWQVGLISALALALSPFQVEFSQETRSYTLLTLTACLTMWMAARLMTVSYVPGLTIGAQLRDYIRSRRGARAGTDGLSGQGFLAGARRFFSCVQVDLTWLGYMFFSALTIYTHNTVVFLPVGINLFVFGLMLYRHYVPAREGQLHAPSFKNWLIAQIGMCLFWLPWAPSFFIQYSGVMISFWIQPPTITVVTDALKNLLLAWLPARLSFSGLIWLGFAAMFVLAAIKNRRHMSRFIFLAGLFLSPFLGELLVSLYRPIFYDRTLIWSAIPLFVLIAEGISGLRYRSYMATALIIFVTLNALSMGNYYTYYEKERWDLAAQYVRENYQDGDIIVFNANWAQIPFDYYFSRDPKPVEEFGAPETMFEFGVLEPRMGRADLPRLDKILQGRTRVWLVYSHNWWTDPNSLIQKELGAKMSLIGVQMYNGMQIQLYQQPKASKGAQ